MNLAYKFYHTCGHIGDGPTKLNAAPEAIPREQRTFQISLAFACPFCYNPEIGIKDGEGLLVILNPPTSPYPNVWHIIRACAVQDIRAEEWSLAHIAGGHVAWIPKPCGTTDLIEGTEGVEHGSTTAVSCSWKQRRGEPFQSRFAGLLSQMNATLASNQRVGG